jgi:hypothetical protein
MGAPQHNVSDTFHHFARQLAEAVGSPWALC